jgi:hypothetical protein
MSICVVAKRCALLGLILAGSGCDLISMPGQTLTLGNRGSVFGSGGNADQAPLPAVRVQPTGTVVVQDADLFGGGIVVSRTDQTQYGIAGQGIISDSGSVRVQAGLVQGGPIVLQTPVDVFDDPAPAIDATASSIDISGGRVVGGSIVSTVGQGLEASIPASGLEATSSNVRITGGTFAAGVLNPAPETDPLLGLNPSVLAVSSNLEIRGGDFTGGIALADSTARIFGGRASAVTFLSLGTSACSEIRGGQFSVFGISGGRIIVAGTDLALRNNLAAGALQITGTLESGEPINTFVVQIDGGQVQLVPPGAPGCP